MNGYLLDTNVISLLAPAKTPPAPFIEWLASEDFARRIFLSVVTLHEIEKGIALLESKGGSARAALLRGWLATLSSTYDDRILSIDRATSSVSGRLEAFVMSAGHAPGIADAMIAGTASVHDLTIVTQNVRHFLPFEIPVLAPNECVVRPSGPHT